MNLKKTNQNFYYLILIFSFLILISCNTQEEVVNINELLTEGAVTEIINAYPDFKVSLVVEKNSNVDVKFGDKFIRIDGVDNDEKRIEMATWILQYLENPNKKEADKAKQNLTLEAKFKKFIEKIKSNNPNFDYEWVELGKGNVKREYRERSLFIKGIDDEGSKEEIAAGIFEFQRAINRAQREAYNNLPPKEKMEAFVERLKSRYPDFDYKWVGLGEGNTEIEYGDNSLLIIGVERSKGEIANEIFKIQKEIDKLSTGEQK